MDKKIIQQFLTSVEFISAICRDEKSFTDSLELGVERYLLESEVGIKNIMARYNVSENMAASYCEMFYAMHFWRFAKTVYDFSPRFLSLLEQTEDAPVYKNVLEHMPYRDFLMTLPEGLPYDIMLVHIEFENTVNPEEADVLFFLCLRTASSANNEKAWYNIIRQPCRSGEMLLKTFMQGAAKYADQNESNEIARCMRIAVSACYYLASKNAEIREVRVPKSDRPTIPSSHGGKPKRVAVKAYQVGYTLGKSFEQQLKEQPSASRQTTGPTGGHTVRPHVRRAHWHHYWTGAGRTTLEVRWIEPTLVLPGGKGETELPTIRKVHGPERKSEAVQS